MSRWSFIETRSALRSAQRARTAKSQVVMLHSAVPRSVITSRGSRSHALVGTPSLTQPSRFPHEFRRSYFPLRGTKGRCFTPGVPSPSPTAVPPPRWTGLAFLASSVPEGGRSAANGTTAAPARERRPGRQNPRAEEATRRRQRQETVLFLSCLEAQKLRFQGARTTPLRSVVLSA